VNLAISSGGSTTPFRKLKASSIRAYPRHEFRGVPFLVGGHDSAVVPRERSDYRNRRAGVHRMALDLTMAMHERD